MGPVAHSISKIGKMRNQISSSKSLRTKFLMPQLDFFFLSVLGLNPSPLLLSDLLTEIED